MKLHTLQLFLRSLIEPLSHSAAGPSAVEDLRRASDLLASFGDMNLSEFASTLEQAKAYQQAKVIAVPPSLRAFVASFETLRSLKSRAAAPETKREDVIRELQAVPLDGFEKNELAQLASDLGISLKQKPTKSDAISALWLGITGSEKPARSSARPSKAKTAFPVEEYAQKVSALKDRAISPDTTREELEQSLAELNLKAAPAKDLVALAKQLSCDVNSKTKKEKAIAAIEDVVLGAKELVIGGAG